MFRTEIIQGASRNIRLALGLLVAGTLIHLIGMAAPYWTVISDNGFRVYSGLWTSCFDPGSCFSTASTVGWLTGVKFLEMTAFLLLGGVFGCLFVYRMKERRLFIMLAAIWTIVAEIFIVLGYIIYTAKTPLRENLNWAFGLEIVASLIILPAAVLLGREVQSGRSAGYVEK